MVRMLFIMIPFADDAERQVKNECARQQYRTDDVQRSALHRTVGPRKRADFWELAAGRRQRPLAV